MFLIILEETLTHGYKAEYLDLISLISIFFGVSIIISKNPILSVLSWNSPGVPYAFTCLPIHSDTGWSLVLTYISYIIKRIRLILDIMIKNLLNDTVNTLINLDYVFFRADSAFFVLIIKNITFILDKYICNIFIITAHTFKRLLHVFFISELAIFAWALTLVGLAFGGVIWYNCLLSIGLLNIVNKLIFLGLTSLCLIFLITIYIYLNYINVEFKVRYPYLYFVLNVILIIVIPIGLDYTYHSFLDLIDEFYKEIYVLYKFIEILNKFIEILNQAWVYVKGKGKGKAPGYNPESSNPRGPNNPDNPGGPNIPGGPGGPNRGSYFPPIHRDQEGRGEDQQGYSSQSQGQDNTQQEDNLDGYWGYAEPRQSSGYRQGEQGSYNQEFSNPGYTIPTQGKPQVYNPDNYGVPTQGMPQVYNPQSISNPWYSTQTQGMPQDSNPDNYGVPTQGMPQVYNPDNYGVPTQGMPQVYNPQGSYHQGYPQPVYSTEYQSSQPLHQKRGEEYESYSQEHLKNPVREKENAKRRERRANLTFQEWVLERESVNASEKERRAKLTDQELEERREIGNAYKKRRLAKLTDQELEERRERINADDRERRAKKKANRPEGEEN